MAKENDLKNFMEYLKNNKKSIAAHAGMLLVTVCLVAGVFCFWSEYKVIWFCDEIYSYFTANSGQGVGARITYKTWYDSQFVVDDMTAECGRFFSRTINNVRSDDHPPIYFLTMHAMSLLMRGSISKWVGLAVNLLCVIGISILVYLLIYLITQKKLAAMLSAVALGVVPSFLTNAMLIRMYCMMTAWAVLYVFLSYLITYRQMSRKVKTAAYLALSVTTACGFLTQYYFAVFAVGFTLVYSFYCMTNKQWKDMINYILSMVLAVVLATVLWSFWLVQIFNRYCGEAVLSQALDFSKIGKELIAGFTYIPKLIFYKWYIVGILVSVLCIVFLVRMKDKFVPIILQLVGGSFFYSLVVAHVTPTHYLDYRYFYMATAVVYIALLITFIRCVSYVKIQAVKKYGAYAVLVFLIAFHCITSLTDEMSMGYVDTSGEYNNKREVLESYGNLPWVYYGYESWSMMENYYDFALGSRFIVYNDQNDFESGKCPGEGSDFIFMINNVSYRKPQQVLKKLEEMSGCEHEVTFLFNKGSHIYLVSHKH